MIWRLNAALQVIVVIFAASPSAHAQIDDGVWSIYYEGESESSARAVRVLMSYGFSGIGGVDESDEFDMSVNFRSEVKQRLVAPITSEVLDDLQTATLNHPITLLPDEMWSEIHLDAETALGRLVSDGALRGPLLEQIADYYEIVDLVVGMLENDGLEAQPEWLAPVVVEVMVERSAPRFLFPVEWAHPVRWVTEVQRTSSPGLGGHSPSPKSGRSQEPAPVAPPSRKWSVLRWLFPSPSRGAR